MYSYLALGDSYTIGELVPMAENFPFQTVTMLRERHLDVADPVIVAKTGWTTDELQMAIREQGIKETFSIVTLLIGVNNQYRGRDVSAYQKEFQELLEQAIVFANGHARHVFVLSIPDWGVTPFASDRDRAQIAREIDAYNKVKHDVAAAFKCPYLDITDSTRRNGNNPAFLAEDALHPSGKEYAVWASRLAPVIEHMLRD